MLYEVITKYWPENLGHVAWKWCKDNLTLGRVKDSTFNFVFASDEEGKNIVNKVLKGTVYVNNATVITSYSIHYTKLYDTGYKLKQIKKTLAGKTGTTNNNYDAWFVGFSPDLVVAVFVGYDNPRPIGRDETGSKAAAPIFVDFMQNRNNFV